MLHSVVGAIVGLLLACAVQIAVIARSTCSVTPLAIGSSPHWNTHSAVRVGSSIRGRSRQAQATYVSPLNGVPASGVSRQSIAAEMRSYGLPWHCVTVDIEWYSDGTRLVQGGVELSSGVVVPTRLRWLPAIANALVITALCFVLLFTVHCSRRWLRARQQRCPHCGYPASANHTSLSVCPECGRPASLRMAASSPSRARVELGDPD